MFFKKNVHEGIQGAELYREAKTNDCTQKTNQSCPGKGGGGGINANLCDQVTNVKVCS